MRRVCVFCGSAAGARPEYAAAAEALGRAIAARGLGLVFGGGAVGLMGIVSRAALAAGAPVTGIIPHGLVMREAGNRDLPDLRVVASMHERKAMMAEMSDGFLVLPGGYGTLEEVVEALTWLQLGIHRKGVAFVDTLGFWSRQMAMLDHMVAEGFLKPEMRRMAMIAPDAEGALDALAGFAAPDVPRWLVPGEA
ncbi:TIGR00730 family Rossman fold protein [Roseomonas sp. PWR1]|uniref:Cytokinin riboside 5'-monophosphate phosphoribohydrolase n=1 Tax=Roseomonas nitratireducens TaxID=2820810 RepID=A0ABS4ANL4_9PROT|nr:TIGR00730 family Rossman fold protein [Neoroseomonas nitratireducens]MBP0462431.1 TIGR00730 family Rossman fold protein [Neoroseomonas nitratireducens]